jgi:hypothetical protein
MADDKLEYIEKAAVELVSTKWNIRKLKSGMWEYITCSWSRCSAGSRIGYPNEKDGQNNNVNK